MFNQMNGAGSATLLIVCILLLIFVRGEKLVKWGATAGALYGILNLITTIFPGLKPGEAAKAPTQPVASAPAIPYTPAIFAPQAPVYNPMGYQAPTPLYNPMGYQAPMYNPMRGMPAFPATQSSDQMDRAMAELIVRSISSPSY